MLYPFWQYFGGKWRAAPKYPRPVHSKIVEPFAGAAGYSLRYHWLDITLVEKYAVIAEIWRYLISVRRSEFMRLPVVRSVDDLPSKTPIGARYLIGFLLNKASTRPGRNATAGVIHHQDAFGWNEGFTIAKREQLGNQLDSIRHWKIIEGTYRQSPARTATWFIDPPYQSACGRSYVHSDIDYTDLASFSVSRPGQVIVCDNTDATWLPFSPFLSLKVGCGSNRSMNRSMEAIWTKG